MVKVWFWPGACFFHNGSFVGGHHLGLNVGCRDKPGRKSPKRVFVLFCSGWFYFGGFSLFIFSIGGRNFILISISRWFITHFVHQWPKNPKIDPFYDVTGKFSCHLIYFLFDSGNLVYCLSEKENRTQKSFLELSQWQIENWALISKKFRKFRHIWWRNHKKGRHFEYFFHK